MRSVHFFAKMGPDHEITSARRHATMYGIGGEPPPDSHIVRQHIKPEDILEFIFRESITRTSYSSKLISVTGIFGAESINIGITITETTIPSHDTQDVNVVVYVCCCLCAELFLLFVMYLLNCCYVYSRW